MDDEVLIGGDEIHQHEINDFSRGGEGGGGDIDVETELKDREVETDEEDEIEEIFSADVDDSSLSKRWRVAVMAVSAFYLTFTVIRAIVGAAIAWELLGRRFATLPFFLVLLADFLIVGPAAVTRRQRGHWAGCFGSLLWLVVTLALAVAVWGLTDDEEVREVMADEGWKEMTRSLESLTGLWAISCVLLCGVACTQSIAALRDVGKCWFWKKDGNGIEVIREEIGLTDESDEKEKEEERKEGKEGKERKEGKEGKGRKGVRMMKSTWFWKAVIWTVVAIAAVAVAAGLLDVANSWTSIGYCHPQQRGCYFDCDPIDPTECLFPFPNSFYETSDIAHSSSSGGTSSDWRWPSETGIRLWLPTAALPQSRAGYAWTAGSRWEELDGWSTVGPLLFHLPDGSAKGLPVPGPVGIEESLLEDCPVVLIDTATGSRVPLYVELDAIDFSSPSFVVQPAVPLRHATRHVVGVRRIVSKQYGTPVMPSAAMKLLLRPDLDADSESIISQERHEKFHTLVLPVLLDQGFVVEEIQLAWDFTTNSRNNLLTWPRALLAEGLRMQAQGLVQASIISVEEGDCSDMADWNRTRGRLIQGVVKTPLFLHSAHRLALLDRSKTSSNSVSTSQFHEYPFMIIVPCSLLRSRRPARLLLEYGHGLFGSRREVMSHKYTILANQNDWVFVASDWFGMAAPDVPAMAKILMADMSRFAAVPESTLQGFVDRAVLLRVILRQLASSHPSLQVGSENIIPLLSPNSQVAYYGNSQGGILGGGYFGFSPDHNRALLGVPGTPYALLLSRSRDFDGYRQLLELSLYTWRHQRIAITLMGQLWDRGESAGWLRDAVSGGKQVLIHAAIGDAQVSTLGAHIMARAFNASTVRPQTRPIYGVPELSAPLPPGSSAIVEWLYQDGAVEPVQNLPAVGPDTHECPRVEVRAHRQMKRFLEDGLIDQFCDGPCLSPHACPSF